MKKRILIIFLVFLSFSLLGCGRTNKQIDKKKIANLAATKTIILSEDQSLDVWPAGKSSFTDANFINDILQMLDNVTITKSSYNKDDFNMVLKFYKESSDGLSDVSDILEEIIIYPDFKTISFVSDEKATQYSIPKDYDLQTKLKEAGVNFYVLGGTSTSCTGQDLFYEDENYKYYVDCNGEGERYITFLHNNLTLPLLEAINKKYITIEEIEKDYPNYFTKENIK